MSKDCFHTILLVDDDQSILNAYCRDLQELDAEIIATTDVHEAVQILKKRSISLVISDERMPLCNGCRFLALAEEISPSTLRVLITGFANVEVINTAVKRAHVTRYFLKPWDPATFASSIWDLLANHEREQV